MKINEKLGVPEKIEEAGEKVYSKIIKNVKNISAPDHFSKETDNLYKITSVDVKIEDVDVKNMGVFLKINYTQGIIGDKYKLPLIISLSFVSPVDDYEVSKKSGKVYTDLTPDENSSFQIDVAIDDKSNKKEDVIRTIKKDLDVSTITHELKHFYDYSKKGTKYLDDLSRYGSYTIEGVPPLLKRFLYLLYFLEPVENLTRPSELYHKLIDNDVRKENFKSFVESTEMMKTIKEAENFSIEEFKKNIRQSKEIDKFLENLEKELEPFIRSGDDVKDIFNILFSTIANQHLQDAVDQLKKFVYKKTIDKNPMLILNGLFGKDKDSFSEEYEKIADNNLKRIVKKYEKYQNNPEKFFDFLEKRLNLAGNKMKRKIYKLYDMVKENNSSVINWDAHSETKGSKVNTILDFNKFTMKNSKNSDKNRNKPQSKK